MVVAKSVDVEVTGNQVNGTATAYSRKPKDPFLAQVTTTSLFQKYSVAASNGTAITFVLGMYIKLSHRCDSLGLV